METLNQNITNTSIKNRDDSSIKCDINLNQPIEIGELNASDDCDMSLSFVQTANIRSCNLSSMSSFSDTSAVKNQIQAAIDSTAKSGQKSVNDFMSTAFSDQKQSSEFVTNIKNIVENNFSSDMAKTCNSSATINASQPFKVGKIICSGTSTINNIISQDAQMEVYAKCMTDAVTNLLSESEMVAKAVQKVENSQSSENSGVGNIISSFLGAYMTTFIVIAVVALVAFYIFFSFGGMDVVNKAVDKAGPGGMGGMGGAGGMGGSESTATML